MGRIVDRLQRRILHHLVDTEQQDVLEIGCGDGRLTWHLARHARSVLAFDPCTKAIHRAQRVRPAWARDKVRLERGHLGSISIPPASFDIAVFGGSL